MRIRTIKPEFWESENLGNVSREARLLFIGLFSSCDDHGRTRASSRILASRLFPYDDDALKLLPKWLKELESKNCVRIYEVEGETYLDIPKWLNHQKIDKPSASKLPSFADIREDSRGFAKNSLGTGNREQGEEQGEELGESDELFTPSPKKESLTDEEWLKSLSCDPAYAGVNVSTEFAKMSRWCEVNRKSPSRRRFINWINRIEKPLSGTQTQIRTGL